MPGELTSVTQLLRQLKEGHSEVLPQLIESVYREMRRIAKSRMQIERAGHTLTPTALVHETYMRLASAGELKFESRSHFLAVAAQAMRRILVDHARARGAARRGVRVDAPVENLAIAAPESDETILALDDALNQLAKLSPRQSQVVELRFFGGLTEDAVAEVLGVTRRTVNRDWQFARVWLRSRISTVGGL